MSIRHEMGPFAVVPLWISEALTKIGNPEAIRLFIALHRWTGATRTCWPAKRTIAEACGVSENTVDRYRAALVQVGALRVEQRWDDDGNQSSNAYTLVVTPPSIGGGGPTGGGRGDPVGGTRTRSISNKNSLPTKPSADRSFEAWWLDYRTAFGTDKSGSKGRALTSWRKLTVAERALATSALERHRENILADPNGYVAPHAVTWLNQRRFLDDALQRPPKRPDAGIKQIVSTWIENP